VVPPGSAGRAAVDQVSRRKLDLLIRDFARLVNSEVALLCQLGSKGQPPAVISSWGLGTTHDETVRPREGGFVGRAHSLPRAALEPLHPLLDSTLVHATCPPLSHAAAAPVRLPTGVAGRLIAGFVSPPEDQTQTLWTAETYAALIALCLQHPGALDGLLATARRDGLTGCLTYDATRHELDREINRSVRGDLQLSICFIDLDGFKRVNDDHGHLRGNETLARVGQILRDEIRSCDTIGRYGGDEFIAIFPETTETDARALAERMRSQLTVTAISSLQRPLSASIGVAEWTPGTASEALLAAADRALLAAKALRTGVMTASAAAA
jgi:diguanylate cyclase (GGDEF)-like protein